MHVSIWSMHAYSPGAEPMDKIEFSTIRKKLKKTQKEIAELLGISLKAVSSYEQGWRVIPGHVERQILFLLSRKLITKRQNCWDILQCPTEKRTKCPAWEFKSGDLCWFINGTICHQQAQKSWQDKIAICRTCPVMQNLLNP
jgi:hypothetical protein